MTTMIVQGELPKTGTILDSYVTFDHIPMMTRIALWAGHLYRGTVTCWAGEGGCGKGITAIWIGAAVVTGGLMPGESPSTTRDRTPARVLGVWPEDDANEDLAQRWDAAIRAHLAMMHEAFLRNLVSGAKHIVPEEVKFTDLMAAVPAAKVAEACALVTNLTESLEDEPFTMGKATQSLADMRAVIDYHADPANKSIPVAYVIIDPLLAVTDTTLGSNTAARKVLWPLMRMAKETGVAVMLTHHTTKNGEIAGSKGVTDVLRLVYMATWDEKNPDMVIVHKKKGNNVGRVADLRYSITGGEQHPWVVWQNPEQQAKKEQRPSWRERVAASQAAPSAHPRAASMPALPRSAPVPQQPAQRPSQAIWGQPTRTR